MSAEKLKDYTADLLTLETHLYNAVNKQRTSDQAGDADAMELLNSIDRILRSQIDALENQIDRLGGGRKSDLKELLGSFAGLAAGLIDSVRKDPVSKMLRDDYTALSMLATGYTMLHTHALGMDDQELAELSVNHLGEITPVITELSRVIPMVVARESTGLDKSTAEEIGRKAMEETQKMWRAGQIDKEPVVL
ncbi:hypothetical protein [Rhodohalobacter mucosus]|uniref:Ferritin-like metal-binding protein YciE n=1 Tax=Rhodohalobacter mucosus TaxID=2079485 RepID=A0A316TSD8_9BACT|nr:hypothetical protein [Rhodohalobacter mucosus]PWN07310.1 hypothetical protein DDZ15_03310 [Rhodohalobacter mucosus]